MQNIFFFASSSFNIFVFVSLSDKLPPGWTYGLNEDSERRRSPHLLPYVYVDEAIKVANRNTASETVREFFIRKTVKDFLMMSQVRTLLVYGYVLDPPTGDVEQAEVAVSRHPTHRTYRAENTYGVSSGKWFV